MLREIPPETVGYQGIQFIASWDETLLVSPFVDYGLQSSGMQLYIIEVP